MCYPRPLTPRFPRIPRCLCERGGALLLCFSTSALAFMQIPCPLCERINSTLLNSLPASQPASQPASPARKKGDMEDAKQRAAAAAEEEEASVSLKELSRKLDEFARDRDWEQHHSPRNLLLAMVYIYIYART